MAHVSLARAHLEEAVDLFSRTTVLAVFYTLVLILYCLSFRLSYAQLRTVLLTCATLDIIIKNRHVQLAYIDDAALPGGSLSIFAALSTHTLSNLDSVVTVLEEFLIVGVLLWRVWVVLSGTPFVIPFTIVSIFLYLASGGLASSYSVIMWNVDDRSLVALPRVGAIIFIISLVICLGNLASMTLTIIARLVFIRRQHIKLMGKSDVASQYLSIAAMLIESYALNTTWKIGLLISYVLKYAPTTYLFLNCRIQVDILTEFLVIYQVLSGRAWTRQTQDHLSTLKWASNEAFVISSGTAELRQTSVLEEDRPVTSSAVVDKS